jgi:hypothetical protein
MSLNVVPVIVGAVLILVGQSGPERRVESEQHRHQLRRYGYSDYQGWQRYAGMDQERQGGLGWARHRGNWSGDSRHWAAQG